MEPVVKTGPFKNSWRRRGFYSQDLRRKLAAKVLIKPLQRNF